MKKGNEEENHITCTFSIKHFLLGGMHVCLLNVCLSLLNSPEKDGGKSQISGDKEISKTTGGHDSRQNFVRL